MLAKTSLDEKTQSPASPTAAAATATTTILSSLASAGPEPISS
jgi:hypothetical protein